MVAAKNAKRRADNKRIRKAKESNQGFRARANTGKAPRRSLAAGGSGG